MTQLQKVDALVLHHVGPMPKAWEAMNPHQLREAIRAEHLKKEWADIGYHKLCFENGDVLQGRPDAVVGAQAWGYNSHSLGILAVGNFMAEEPSEQLLDTLVQVCAVLCKRYHLTPDRIIGHRDVAGIIHDPTAATACPGDKLYALLPELRRRVGEYL